MFRRCFQNNCNKLFSQFQQNFLRGFTVTLIHPIIFLKFYAKILFLFRPSSSTTFFFNLTKIRRHYFYKTYKIFEKFDGVSRTFSVSSLEFLLKLASHYEKLRSQVFHPRRERLTIFVYGQLQNKRFVPNLSIKNLSIDTSSRFCLQVCTKPNSYS